MVVRYSGVHRAVRLKGSRCFDISWRTIDFAPRPEAARSKIRLTVEARDGTASGFFPGFAEHQAGATGVDAIPRVAARSRSLWRTARSLRESSPECIAPRT